MDGPRQNTQLALAFMDAPTGEAPKGVQQGTESSAAKREPERPAREERLMEEVCERNNLVKAWKQVRGNKGVRALMGRPSATRWTPCANTGQPFGTSCFKEPTGHSRCAG